MSVAAMSEVQMLIGTGIPTVCSSIFLSDISTMAPLSSLLSQPKSPSDPRSASSEVEDSPRSASSEVEDSPQPASAEAVDPPQPDLIKAEDLSDIQSDTTESEYPSDSQPDTTDFEEGSDAESNAKSEMMDELFEEEETRNDEKLQIAPVSQFHESKPWIANYHEEEQRGIAILQRRRRLTRENSDRNGDELIQLNGEYWMHQVRFRRIQIAELPNNDYVEAMMIPRRYLDRHGCPYDWVISATIVRQTEVVAGVHAVATRRLSMDLMVRRSMAIVPLSASVVFAAEAATALTSPCRQRDGMDMPSMLTRTIYHQAFMRIKLDHVHEEKWTDWMFDINTPISIYPTNNEICQLNFRAREAPFQTRFRGRPI